MNLYFAPTPRSSSFVDVRFLQLVQGLETLHRRSYPKRKTFEKEEFQGLVETLSRAIPSDKQDWLNNKLLHANEPSLRQRIKEIVTPFEKWFGNKKERKNFIDKVINTRNYLTHYDETGEKKAATDESLRRLTLKLEGLFQLDMMRRIGFDVDQIEYVILTNRNLKDKLEI